MFAPTREESRRFFFDTWEKYRRGEPLQGLERVALQVIVLHPEYHAVLDEPERYAARDYGPESGEMNPFLHLALHVAVEEQLAIDQPRGIAALYRRLLARTGGEHDAKHAVLECLGETLWRAQCDGTPPDEALYLDCLERRAGG